MRWLKYERPEPFRVKPKTFRKPTQIETFVGGRAADPRELVVADRLLAGLLVRFWQREESPCVGATQTAQSVPEDDA